MANRIAHFGSDDEVQDKDKPQRHRDTEKERG
jgi:hypothetical protein